LGKKNSKTIHELVAELEADVEFLESTDDLDFAIERYKTAIETSVRVSKLLNDRKQVIIELTQKLDLNHG